MLNPERLHALLVDAIPDKQIREIVERGVRGIDERVKEQGYKDFAEEEFDEESAARSAAEAAAQERKWERRQVGRGARESQAPEGHSTSPGGPHRAPVDGLPPTGLPPGHPSAPSSPAPAPTSPAPVSGATEPSWPPSPQDAGSINIIPGGIAGSCRPVLFAFAHHSSQRYPYCLTFTLRRVRELLIRCAGTTQIVVLVTNVWEERYFEESRGDFGVHAAKSKVGFVGFLATSSGLSEASVPVG